MWLAEGASGRRAGVKVLHPDDPTGRLETDAYRQTIDAYMADEVLPYVPDAWVATSGRSNRPTGSGSRTTATSGRTWRS